jgi:hypothetical protein
MADFPFLGIVVIATRPLLTWMEIILYIRTADLSLLCRITDVDLLKRACLPLSTLSSGLPFTSYAPF